MTCFLQSRILPRVQSHSVRQRSMKADGTAPLLNSFPNSHLNFIRVRKSYTEQYHDFSTAMLFHLQTTDSAA